MCPLLNELQEVELGEYVADYAYHERDLEGNYYDPSQRPSPRAASPLPSPSEKQMKRSHLDPSPDTRTTITDLDGDTVAPTEDSRSRSRGRSRPRAIRMHSLVEEDHPGGEGDHDIQLRSLDRGKGLET